MGNIIDKIKEAGLVGRGGGCFPVADKWLMVKNVVSGRKYVVCNGAEGEPGVEKDGYILEHYGEEVINGMMIAIDFFSAEKGYLYLNYHYFNKFGKKLTKLLAGKPIEIFVKPISAGYIGGEESAVLNAIEGRRVEPRLRPPFPTTHGLFGCPTLINNMETFYNVSLVVNEKYKNERFYTVSGDCPNNGVYCLPDNFTIARILKATNNYPRFNFFVQIGGDASGQILNQSQLKRPVNGTGSITVYSLEKNSFKKLVKAWLQFFVDESCGQCTPCREGVYRLKEIIMADKVNWDLFKELLDNLSDTAFCGLGCAVPIAITSFISNVLPQLNDKKIEIKGMNKKTICECFK